MTTSSNVVSRWWDAATNAIDALPSPALYALVVGATIGVSLALLGSAKDVGGVEERDDEGGNAGVGNEGTASSASAPPTTAAAAAATKNNVPEPRWHWFRYMNGLILVAFLSSIVLEFRKTTDQHPSSDVNHHTNDSSNASSSWWVFLLGWSTFMCYFFGFFGITFVHKHL